MTDLDRLSEFKLPDHLTEKQIQECFLLVYQLTRTYYDRRKSFAVPKRVDEIAVWFMNQNFQDQIPNNN